jgi:hypothetical protein
MDALSQELTVKFEKVFEMADSVDSGFKANQGFLV